jgi:uncharacterized protein
MNLMNKHHHIDYFELPSGDLAASKHFYASAFGWNFTDYGPTYAGFGYPGAEREAGGMTVEKEHARAPLAILYSDNLEASEKSVVAAGGKIVKPIFSFPGGRRFHFTDPSGNELAIWSDK